MGFSLFEALLILVRFTAAVSNERNHRQHDECKDTDHRAQVVLLLVNRQLIQPGDQKVRGASSITNTYRFASGEQVNNIEVIGGQVPYLGSIEYTQEEIEQVHKVNELNLQTLQKPAPATPQVKEGFDSPSSENSISLDSEIPDF